MAVGDKRLQPIIIKRVKKGGHAAHGAAWKIAYADFVTAMMAFFLLMWLLGSTTKGDRQGIQDYFNSPLQVALFGGSGSGDASHVIKGGGQDLTRTTGQVKQGDVEAQRKHVNLAAALAERRKKERARLERLKAKVEAVIAANPKLAEFGNQIRLEITANGLRIEIVDDQRRPMFDLGGGAVKDYMRELLRSIGGVLNEVENRVSLSGHTDATPYGGGDRGYSNWELSADRANASRRELIAGGMHAEKVIQVVGQAASVLLDPADPRNPVNRRISIMVLNEAAEQRILHGKDLEVDEASDVKEQLPSQPGIIKTQPGGGSTSAGQSDGGNIKAPAEIKQSEPSRPAGDQRTGAQQGSR